MREYVVDGYKVTEGPWPRLCRDRRAFAEALVAARGFAAGATVDAQLDALWDAVSEACDLLNTYADEI